VGSALAHQRDYGWRSSTVAGALGLRPAVAQISAAEGALIERVATGTRTGVQIGVAEGGSAWHARKTMDPAGVLYLIDTYPKVLGMNMSSIIARRLVGSVDGARVEWIRARSDEASVGWDTPIDFLFIDGDHAYEAVKRDWEEWSRHVTPTGHVAFHDALTEAAWMDDSFGSARFVSELRSNAEWTLVEGADSVAVFGRSGPNR
jgi:predicted O-methyltransferase YrrM